MPVVVQHQVVDYGSARMTSLHALDGKTVTQYVLANEVQEVLAIDADTLIWRLKYAVEEGQPQMKRMLFGARQEFVYGIPLPTFYQCASDLAEIGSKEAQQFLRDMAVSALATLPHGSPEYLSMESVRDYFDRLLHEWGSKADHEQLEAQIRAEKIRRELYLIDMMYLILFGKTANEIEEALGHEIDPKEDFSSAARTRILHLKGAIGAALVNHGDPVAAMRQIAADYNYQVIPYRDDSPHSAPG